MPNSSSRRGYNHAYRKARAALLGPSGGGLLLVDPRCHWNDPGCTFVATTADHEPPLYLVGRPHLNLVPACEHCNYGRARRRRGKPSRVW